MKGKVINMKLIAETAAENIVLPGLATLLEDFGVPTAEYRTEEAYAVTFLSVSELSHLYADRVGLTQEEIKYILEEMEPILRAAMYRTSLRVLDHAIHKNISSLKKISNRFDSED